MSENTQLAERPTSVKDYLALPAYRDRFHEVMGKRANQFMAAIVASSQLPGLKDAEPRSVIAAAMVAATLDLPVNPTLGQAHLVAYADGSGNKVAQFQIGYKGLIQLALRSGQYKRLNAGPVNGSVFKGYDIVGEPILDWTAFEPTAEVTGYFCAFETLNGFIKVVYWSKAQAEAHAKRFSRAYAKGYSTPWKSDFDSMATKTVIKAALGKWGLLSVEMQKAVVHDQGAQLDVDADVKYVDGAEDATPVQGADEISGDAPPKRAPGRPRKSGLAAAAAPEVVVPPEEQASPPTEVEAAEKAAQAKRDAEAKADADAKAAELARIKAENDAAMKAREAKTAKSEDPDPEPDEQRAPRTSLNANETATFLVTVTEATAMTLPDAEQGSKSVPTAQIRLDGEYSGRVYHYGCNPADWVARKGQQVRVTLFGFQQNGRKTLPDGKQVVVPTVFPRVRKVDNPEAAVVPEGDE